MFVLSTHPMDSVHVSVGIYSFICVTSFLLCFLYVMLGSFSVHRLFC